MLEAVELKIMHTQNENVQERVISELREERDRLREALEWISENSGHKELCKDLALNFCDAGCHVVADDQAQVCWCAGSTCSGCEAHTRKLVKSGADFGYAFRDNQVDKLIEHTFKKKIEVGSLISRIAELEAALKVYAMTNETFPEYGDVARKALGDKANE